MELIVITPELAVDNEIHIVNQLFHEGLCFLHLRKPQFGEADYRRYINQIQQDFHSRIVIHGAYQLFDQFGLAGIHLNTAARNNREVWEQAGGISPKNISTSFHSWDEIIENEFQYGSVFISPVFDSISKVGYKAAIDLDGAAKTKTQLANENKYCPKIIGLGGVGPLQVDQLYKYGFDGGAMLGAIWQSDAQVSVFREAMNKIKILEEN